MMAEQVEPDIFHPPCHKLKPNMETKLDTLLKEYASQFMQRMNMSIGTTPLTEMMIDRGTPLTPASQKPYPICHEKLSMGKGQNRETTVHQRTYEAVDQVGQCQS